MTVINHFLAAVNILHVIVAGIAYWLVGAVWFSMIFGKAWGSELEKHGVKLNDKGGMAGKFIGTLIMEIIIAFGCAFLVWYMNIETVMQAVKLGLGASICFAALPMMIAYSWESRPMKLVLIDIGYPIVGITVSMIILALWK